MEIPPGLHSDFVIGVKSLMEMAGDSEPNLMASSVLLALISSLTSLSATAAEPPQAPPVPPGMAAYADLVQGNTRFSEGQAKRPNQDPETRLRLSQGQSPHAIVLSCSDSRVPPELVFDQGLGDLISIRVAGNVPSNDAIASIEYAIEHMGSKLVVILGHDSCGTIKAALLVPEGKSAGTPEIDHLLAKIRPHIHPAGSTDPTLAVPAHDNVHATAEALIRRSSLIRTKVRSREIVLAQGVYRLGTGKVEFWDVGATFEGLKVESPAKPLAPPELKARKPASIVEKPVPTEVPVAKPKTTASKPSASKPSASKPTVPEVKPASPGNAWGEATQETWGSTQ